MPSNHPPIYCSCFFPLEIFRELFFLTFRIFSALGFSSHSIRRNIPRSCILRITIKCFWQTLCADSSIMAFLSEESESGLSVSATVSKIIPPPSIAITVSPGKDCFVATAKVYPSYKDSAECYLAEATASRGYLADKPSVSPREWAQTAAVGIALRNAGFGLQFAMAGDEFEDTATDELNGNSAQAGGSTPHENSTVMPEPETEEEYTVEPTAPPQRELTFEEKVEQAMRVPCPITKYGGKTLGDVLQMDPKAIQWCATKFTGGEEIRNAAKLICEYAQQKASA